MPIKKRTTAKNSANEVKSDPQDGLMDFEQFVAQKPKNSGGKSWLAVTLIVVIVVLAGAIFFLNQGQFDKELKYQAIFLDNNQVYFAKVAKEDSLNIYLADVFYIQTQQQVIPATEEGGEDQVVDIPTLVRRGGEVHQPQGWLQLNRDKVVSIEEIGTDSEVMKEINRLNASPVSAPTPVQ